MTTTKPFNPVYDAIPYTDEDDLRRYHKSGVDCIVFRNLKTGKLFGISRTVWQTPPLNENMKNIPAEWRTYDYLMVISSSEESDDC